MADPNPYVPGYSYSGWQASNPTKPLPAPQVDNDFANVATSTQQLVDAVKDVRRSDGALKNGIVTADSLAPDVLVGVATPVAWTTDTEYRPPDTVFISSGADQGVYRATQIHVSDDFAADLAAGKWELIFDLSMAGLATVAYSNDYGDLDNLPTLGTAAATDASDYATAAQGALADTATQPGDLAPVATSGDYDDLTGKPYTVPSGGATGQVLTKSANDDGATVWANPPGGGDMLESVYDPEGVQADAFDSANHAFDNSASGMTATTTQDALDELAADRLLLDGSNVGANAPALRTALQVAAAIEVKSAGYTAGPSDRGKMLVFSSAATLSLTAAATLGPDWPIYVRNESSGDVVLDPDGAEEVDGKTTVMVPPGYTATIWCDGTAFRTDLPKTIQRVYDLAGLGTLEYYIEDGILEEQIDLVGVVTSATASIQSRVSLDGSTYPSGGSDYLRSYFGNGGGSSFAGSTNFNSDRLWDLNATSGTSVMASIIYDPGDAGRHATCLMSGSPNVPGNGRSSFIIAGETASNGRWWGVRIYTTSGTFTAGKVVRRSIRS